MIKSTILRSGKYFGLAIQYATYRLSQLVCCVPGWSTEARSVYQQEISLLLDQKAERYGICPKVLRSEFSKMDLVGGHRTGGFHTHPEAAAARSAGSVNIDRLGKSLGIEVFYLQMANADAKHNRKGSRSWFWAKDTAVKAVEAEIGLRDICAMVDVDYYVDMPRKLATSFRPYLLYTLCPSKVSNTGADYAYTFTKDNQIDYRVSGGGQYQHEVWRYDTDFVGATSYFWGIPTGFATYNIDRRPVDEDHYLVLLTPVARWGKWWAWLSSWLEFEPLDRLRPAQGEFLRLERMGKNGPEVSVGRAGEFIEATVSSKIDTMIDITTRNSKLGLTMPMVQSHVEDRATAAVLYDYHKNTTPAPAPKVFPIEDSVRGYQFEPENYEQVPTSLKPFMSPIIDGCYSPDSTISNERACINNRIINVKSDQKITPFLSKVMDEFIEQFIPAALRNKGDPVDDDKLYEMQDRPTQRRILQEAEFTVATDRTRKVGMFVKKEAYGTPNDPRPISTINGNDKANYSKYIYAFADYIKLQDWYAFGKPPRWVALKVAKLCADAMFDGSNSDFSRFDGHLSPAARELERRLFLAFFKAEYHADIIDLHSSQFNLDAFGRFGTKYFTGNARASGSPETAAFNSLLNAFVAFLAFRMTKVNGKFMTPEEAYARLGLYGGDDGFTTDIDADVYVKAAALLGQKLVVEKIPKGQMGVKFLARIYGPDVWFDDPSSCCDIYRQLSKFHATVNLPSTVTPMMKLVEKARAFFLTDRNTPIIGEFVTHVVIHGAGMEETDHLRIWSNGSDCSLDDQYPNEGEWMQAYVNDALPTFDWDAFKAWCDALPTSKAFLTPPLCMVAPEPVVKAAMVIRGELYKPKPQQQAEEGKKSRKEKRAEWRDRNSKSSGKEEPKAATSDSKNSTPKGGKGSKGQQRPAPTTKSA